MNKDALAPVYEEASKFLSAFGPATQIETFQTFPDPKQQNDQEKLDSRELTRIMHSNFESVKKTLTHLNNRHAGIFFSVNQTDLRGRRKNNIIRVRALFADDDVGIKIMFSIEPSIVIKTNQGYHYYFLVKGEFPLDWFEPMMKSLIKQYKTDPKVHDITRVMRLPGFYHVKNVSKPVLIKLHSFHPELRYSFEELKRAFPCLKEESSFGEKKKQQICVYAQSEVIKNYENESSGDFKKIINGGCPALKRSWDKLEVPHYERVALMSLAMRTKNGLEALMQRWPSSVTHYQIENAKNNNLLPYSCRKLQLENICLKGDPVFGDKCFISKNGHEPSPIRLAWGVFKAFKNIEERL